jgi:hypothetical protein
MTQTDIRITELMTRLTALERERAAILPNPKARYWSACAFLSLDAHRFDPNTLPLDHRASFGKFVNP